MFPECPWHTDVLSDPNKKAVYDQFGEEGLKGGVPPGAAGMGGEGAGAGGFRGGYTFDASMVSHAGAHRANNITCTYSMSIFPHCKHAE